MKGLNIVTNYKDDAAIQKRVEEHLVAALGKYNCDWFLCAAQGSMNYGLFTEESDCDTKLLYIPTLEDFVLEKKLLNITYVLEDDTEEHCDIKSVSHYFNIFKKGNLNFTEILFTDYYTVNSLYSDLWLELLAFREDLVHYNPYQVLSCAKGLVLEKQHALEHHYPSKVDIIDKYYYDSKQLQHAIRIHEFIEKYLDGCSFKECMTVTGESQTFMKNLKLHKDNGLLSLEEARTLMNDTVEKVCDIVDKAREGLSKEYDKELDNFLDNICYRIIKRSILSRMSM